MNKPVIRPKHYVIILLGILLASFIFWVNYYYFTGNPILRCLYLSFFTFLFWWGCWSVYFEIRDIWNYRWHGPHISDSNLSIESLKIPITWPESKEKHPVYPSLLHSSLSWIKSQDFLYGEYLSLQNKRNSSNLETKPIIIFIHGFSDDSSLIRYYIIPLVYAGFDVITYDNRGVKKSTKVGFKSQFIEKIYDLGDVIKFIKNIKSCKNRPIYLVGMSLGAMAAIYQCQKYYKNGVKKVVSIATMADYYNVLPQSPILFKKNWWIWIRYKFFGVPINPYPKINEILSPLLKLRKLANNNRENKELIEFFQTSVTLIHAKNDKIIPCLHFYDLIKTIKIESNNWLLVKKGGHNFIKYEIPVIAKVINALKDS